MSQKKQATVTIRVLSADERARLDKEVGACVGEVMDDATTRARAKALPAVGLRGKLARVSHAVKGGAMWVGGLFTQDNLSAALMASKAFAALAVRYGIEETRAAFLRAIQQKAQKMVGGVVGGGGNVAGPR